MSGGGFLILLVARYATMERTLLFWGVCMPVRWTLSNVGDAMWLRVAASVIGLRWVLGYQVGNEGFFGGPAWWAGTRKFHGLLWCFYATTGMSTFLKLDTIYGAYNWFTKRTLP